MPEYTGNQAVTGVGFQPTVLIAFHLYTEQGTNFSTTDAGRYLGFATATTQVSGGFDDINGSTGQLGADNTFIYKAGGRGIATLFSLDADGFTLDWTQTAGGSNTDWYDIAILALGGDDVLGAHAGAFTPTGTTGTQAITGVGFQPNTLLAIGTRVGQAGAFGVNASLMHSFGVAAGPASDQQWVQSLGLQNQNNNRVRARQQDGAVVRYTSDQDGTYGQASLSSFDADGFTLDWTVAAVNTSWRTYYLALDVAHRAVGTFTQPSGTGSQAVTGAGITPQALLVASFGQPATTGYTTQPNLLLGLADGVTQAAGTFRKDDGVSSYAIERREDTSVIVATDDAGAALAHASLTSLDPDGFTLDWTLNDGVLRELKYLAFGAAAGPVYVDATATLATASAVTAAGGFLRDGQASSALASALTESGQRIHDEQLTPVGQSAVHAQATASHAGAADLTALLTLAADASARRDATLAADLTTGVLIVPVEVLAVFLNGASTVTSTPSLLRGSPVTAASAATLAAVPLRILFLHVFPIMQGQLAVIDAGDKIIDALYAYSWGMRTSSQMGVLHAWTMVDQSFTLTTPLASTITPNRIRTVPLATAAASALTAYPNATFTSGLTANALVRHAIFAQRLRDGGIDPSAALTVPAPVTARLRGAAFAPALASDLTVLAVIDASGALHLLDHATLAALAGADWTAAALSANAATMLVVPTALEVLLTPHVHGTARRPPHGVRSSSPIVGVILGGPHGAPT